MFNLVNRARKKNNKGFSLVELIVVVLIIAIIAVALAPQVMKYVGKARTGTDENNLANVKSTVQAAVADYQADGKDLSEDGKYTYSAKNGASSVTEVDGPADLDDYINATAGNDFPKLQDSSATNVYIKVTTQGAVSVSTGALWT